MKKKFIEDKDKIENYKSADEIEYWALIVGVGYINTLSYAPLCLDKLFPSTLSFY